MAVDPAVAEIFAAIQRDDPRLVNDQFGSLPAASQYRRLYELAGRYASPGAPVLDWGCGRGHFSYALVKRGCRVTAYSLEHAPEIFSALSTEEQSRLSFVQGAPAEIRALPFLPDRFSTVFSVGVLEHVRETGGDELASLGELRRVLVPGGAFVCYHLPNRYSYIEAASRVVRQARAGCGWDGFHRYRFTNMDILRLCGAAGLRVEEIGRYGFLPRNSFNRLPAVLRRSRFLASAVDATDGVLEQLFSPFVQNYYFVARA